MCKAVNDLLALHLNNLLITNNDIHYRSRDSILIFMSLKITLSFEIRVFLFLKSLFVFTWNTGIKTVHYLNICRSKFKSFIDSHPYILHNLAC